jgi:hypothetical protein
MFEYFRLLLEYRVPGRWSLKREDRAEASRGTSSWVTLRLIPRGLGIAQQSPFPAGYRLYGILRILPNTLKCLRPRIKAAASRTIVSD